MKHLRWPLILAALMVVVFIPSSAGAETLFVPWVGANTGSGLNISTGVESGASVGVTASGVVGADFDFGYAPDFFGNNLDSSIATMMGNVTFAIPFDRTHASGIRPYVTGGLGLIRTRISVPNNGLSIVNDDLGVDFGGGVITFLGSHVGIRLDLRHFRSLEDDNPPFGPIQLSRLHYWRTSFGLVIR